MAGDVSLKRPDVVGTRSYVDDSQTFPRVSAEPTVSEHEDSCDNRGTRV